MLIDGKWVDSSDGRTFKSMNPATGKSWCRVQEASTKDVDDAVRAADRAC
ncbi:MAG: aldehyde dehydrogenase family protein, partial [Gammaproteobacteria bacterium]